MPDATTEMTKIFVFLSDEELLINFEHLLTDLNYIICGKSKNIEQAMEIIELQQPSLAILEISSKNKTDITKAASIIRNNWNIPVVFFADSNHQHLLDEAVSPGHFWYLPAYFQDRDLKYTIETALHVTNLEKEKERAATAFKKQTERVASAMRLGNLAWWEMKLPSGIVTCDDRKLEMLGRDPAAYRNMHYSAFTDLLHPDDYAKAMQSMRDHLEGKSEMYQLDYRIMKNDGTYLWLHDSGGIAESDAEGQPIRVSGVVMDINARKQTEEALRESQTKLTHILDSMEEIVWSLKYPEFEVLYINPAAERIYDRSLNDFRDNPSLWQDVIHPEDAEKSQEALEQILSEGHSERECRIVRPDGSIRWIIDRARLIYDNDNSPIRIEGTAFDITERKIAEQRLHEANQIINHSPAVLFLWKNTDTWPVEYVSDNVGNLIDYSPDNFLGGNVLYSDIIHPDDLARVVDEVNKYSSSEDQTQFIHEPYRLITKKGEVKWVEDLTTIRRNKNGQISHFQGILLDVTKQKHAEEMLQRQLRFEKGLKLASASLLKSTDSDQCLIEALGHILEATGAARVYVFRNFYDISEELCMRQTHEVRAPGIQGELDNLQLQHLAYRDGFDRWRKTLSADAPIFGNVVSFPLEEQDILKSQGIQSIIVLPINYDGDWQGFIGFDETRSPREWDEEEINLLRTVSDLVGSYLSRKQAYNKLKESETRFREMSNLLPNAIVEMNDEFQITYVNQSGLDLFGYTTADIEIGMNGVELVHQEDREKAAVRIAGHQSGEYLPPTEYRIIRKDGASVPVLFNAAPIFREGHVTGYRCSITDITETKRVEQSLKISKERLSLALEGAELGTWDWDIATGYYVFDKRWASMLGYELHELVLDMKTWEDLLHPDDKKEVLNALNLHLAGGIELYENEHRLRHKSGEWVWVLVRGRVIERKPDGAPVRMCGTHLDITVRKESEDLLRLQSMTLNQIEDRVTVTDLQGVITYVNNAECAMFGKKSEELIGQHVSIYGEDTSTGASQEEIIRQTLERGFWRGEVTNYLDDGTPVILDARTYLVRDDQGRPVAICGISTDITERKKAERSLKESEERFRGVFATSPVGIAIVDTGNQRFIRVNKSFQRLTGYTNEELAQLTVGDITAPEDWRQERQLIEDYFDSKTNGFEIVKNYICKNGEVKQVQVTGDVLHIDNDNTSLAIANVFDITERIRQENEKKRLQDQLQHAQKMEAVGTLAGGIAHDFNNLLQAINGYTQLLLMDKSSHDTDYASLEAIKNASERAATLIRQLLQFSRKARTERKPITLNKEVHHAAGILNRTLPKMVSIEIHPGQGLWLINADPVEIEQILLNLGHNAADAMPDGGKLVIETENVTLDEEYVSNHAGAKTGRYVLLTVSDTGHGMDEDTLKHIFDPFYTTKEIGKGTGLGLASAYGIVKSHGGYIMCYSEVGQGTTFKIYLPAIDGTDSKQVKKVIDRLPPGGSETILLVDDEEAIRSFAKQALSMVGYRILTASSGEEAIETYLSKVNDIDLVMTDLGMPGMGGHKLLRRLLEIDANVKVIIASGYSENAQAKETLEQGAKGYIGKPYHLSHLLQKVREVLDGDNTHFNYN